MEVGLSNEDTVWEDMGNTDAFNNIPQKNIFYKTIMQFYLTPAKMARVSPAKYTPQCPRCQINFGSTVHLLCKCPLLHTFRSDIERGLSTALETTVTLKLQLVFFHKNIELFSQLANFAVAFLHSALIATKKVILQNWIARDSPKDMSWTNELHRLQSMECTKGYELSSTRIHFLSKKWEPLGRF